jgi:hypothetical protein
VLTVYRDTGKDSNRIPGEERLIMVVLHKVNLLATEEDETGGRLINVKSLRPPLPMEELTYFIEQSPS